MAARKNAAGRWESQFTTPPDSRGQRVRLYVVCPPSNNTKEFCQRLERMAVDRHLAGVAPSKLTFREFFETIFLPEYPASRNLEPSSVAAYKYLVGQLACQWIGGMPIAAVDGGAVARLVSRLREQTKIDGAINLEEGRRARARALQNQGQLPGLSTVTIDNALRYLGYVLEWAKSREPTLHPATRLQAAVEQFFAARSDLAPSSAGLYRSLLRLHVVPHIGNLPIGKVNDGVRRHLRETLATAPRSSAVYVPGAIKRDGSLKKPWEVARDRRRGSTGTSPDAKRFSPQTLRNLVVDIKAVLRWAFERKHISVLPKIEIPKVPRPRMALPYSREEARALVAAAKDEQRRVIYILSYDAGCRKSELLGLQWEQIDWEHHLIIFDRQRCRGVLKHTKSGKERSVRMSGPLETALKKRKLAFAARSAFVFCQEDGAPLEEHHLRTFEERDAEAAGLRKVRWHHKRHTFANLVTEEGISPWGLQALLGHADIRTTQGYVKPAQQPMPSVLDDVSSRRTT